MIILRGTPLLAILLTVCLEVSPVQSATYYISPNGSDANPGTSAKPWLTFAFAIDPNRASCGDTLVLMNGTYGDDTNTGKVNINGVVCTRGNELTLSAQNQRQAKIVDNGSGYAFRIQNSAYLIVDGLYVRSTDNSSVGLNVGRVLEVHTSNNIIVRNSLFRNPNRYNNTPSTGAYYSSKVLFEDNESYVFHRHCFTAWESSEIVVRRQYCNPRGGRIAGGYNAVAGLGGADALISMYPCRDCIAENSIADGTTSPMYLGEMNATYGSSILMSGSKILGSICYKCNYGNGIFINSRKVADLNHTPQNIMIKDVAMINFNSAGYGIRCSDCVNATVEHVTITGGGERGAAGMFFDDTATGSAPATSSFTVKDSTVSGVTGTGFMVEPGAYATWSGNNLRSNGNRTAFNQAPPSNWGTTYSNSPTFGLCKGLWLPDGSPGKGQGTGGSDIGATILYRYVNGVLTSIPLWNTRTGEFPHGEEDVDGTNRVAGDSLFDIHTRLNVNTGGCSFPRNYGNSGSDTSLPAAPVGLKAS